MCVPTSQNDVEGGEESTAQDKMNGIAALSDLLGDGLDGLASKTMRPSGKMRRAET